MHVIARGAGAAAALGLGTFAPLWLASAARDTKVEAPARWIGVGASAGLGAGAALLATPRSLPFAARAAIAGAAAIGTGIVGARLGATRPDREPLEPWGPGNGCGEGWWKRAIPDLGFDRACDEHDRYYLKGVERDGRPADRKRADSRMLELGVEQVEDRYGRLDPRRFAGLAAASTYYGTVRVVAGPWWDAPTPVTGP